MRCVQDVTNMPLRSSGAQNFMQRSSVCTVGSTVTSYFCRQEVQVSNARDSVLLKELGKKPLGSL